MHCLRSRSQEVKLDTDAGHRCQQSVLQTIVHTSPELEGAQDLGLGAGPKAEVTAMLGSLKSWMGLPGTGVGGLPDGGKP